MTSFGSVPDETLRVVMYRRQPAMWMELSGEVPVGNLVLRLSRMETEGKVVVDIIMSLCRGTGIC